MVATLADFVRDNAPRSVLCVLATSSSIPVQTGGRRAFSGRRPCLLWHRGHAMNLMALGARIANDMGVENRQSMGCQSDRNQ